MIIIQIINCLLNPQNMVLTHFKNYNLLNVKNDISVKAYSWNNHKMALLSRTWLITGRLYVQFPQEARVRQSQPHHAVQGTVLVISTLLITLREKCLPNDILNSNISSSQRSGMEIWKPSWGFSSACLDTSSSRRRADRRTHNTHIHTLP